MKVYVVHGELHQRSSWGPGMYEEIHTIIGVFSSKEQAVLKATAHAKICADEFNEFNKYAPGSIIRWMDDYGGYIQVICGDGDEHSKIFITETELDPD